jgi:hypothetical protein
MPTVLNTFWRALTKQSLAVSVAASVFACACQQNSRSTGGQRAQTESSMSKTETQAQAVAVDLRVNAVGTHVQATLEFLNRSPQMVFLEKINACASRKIENDVFQIKSEGSAVPYIGMLAKRNPPGPDDFIAIAPQQKFVTAVFLDQAYQFAAGSHVYTARYSALHDYPDKDDYFELQSQEVTFSVQR